MLEEGLEGAQLHLADQAQRVGQPEGKRLAAIGNLRQRWEDMAHHPRRSATDA
jgi:hypothetical protein